jgi:O-methyltransferase involved in polyketide biosynthesis
METRGLTRFSSGRRRGGIFALGTVTYGVVPHTREPGAAKVTGDSVGPEDATCTCGFDPSKPNAARIYNYLLGGKENFTADRDAAEQLLRALPDAARLARANRAFLSAAVRYVAREGIDQYVDIGAGLPTSPNVHECARAAVPEARVTYVDNDPVVVTHARALLATDDLLSVIGADAREYEAILSALELSRTIDLSEPVCVLFVGVLHFMTNSEADALVAAFRERMAPGSYLVVSAGCADDSDGPVGKDIQSAYGAGTVLSGRPRAEIVAYFGDLELVPPGIVPVTEWPVEAPDAPRPRPSGRARPSPAKARMLAGIGRKRS